VILFEWGGGNFSVGSFVHFSMGVGVDPGAQRGLVLGQGAPMRG
jgi:hypothetical protein